MTLLKEYESKSADSVIDYAFKVLKNVEQNDTQWSIVYDVENHQIHFKTQNNPEIKTIKLDSFNFSSDFFIKFITDFEPFLDLPFRV